MQEIILLYQMDGSVTLAYTLLKSMYFLYRYT